MSIRTSASAFALAAALSSAAPEVLASSFLAFTPDPARGTPSTAGCAVEPGLARGALTGSAAGDACHVGQVGPATDLAAFAGGAPTETVATFETAALDTPLALGGKATLLAHLWSESAFRSDPAGSPTAQVRYELREKTASGYPVTIVTGELGSIATGFSTQQASFEIPSYVLAAGSRLQVLIAAGAPETRILFGGEYADSGVTLQGDPAGAEKSGGLAAAAGAMPAATLLLFGVLTAIRRRGRMPR